MLFLTLDVCMYVCMNLIEFDWIWLSLFDPLDVCLYTLLFTWNKIPPFVPRNRYCVPVYWCRVYAMDLNVLGTSRDTTGSCSVSEPSTWSKRDLVRLQVSTSCMGRSKHDGSQYFDIQVDNFLHLTAWNAIGDLIIAIVFIAGSHTRNYSFSNYVHTIIWIGRLTIIKCLHHCHSCSYTFIY